MQYQQYHGLGNHFIITQETHLNGLTLSKKEIEKLCDDKLGIGADGFIIVKTDPLKMLFYNKDGSQASMCGNGIRCFYHYCIDNHLIDFPKDKHTINTLAGDVIVTQDVTHQEACGDVTHHNTSHLLNSNKNIRVIMNKPIYYKSVQQALKSTNLGDKGFQLSLNDSIIECHFLKLGVPHLVINMTSQFNRQNMLPSPEILLGNEAICKQLMQHPLFENGTNINFVNVINRDEIQVLTYERGVGFTTACGTGATASVVSLQNQNLLNHLVKVHLKYGDLTIEKHANEDDIFYTMTGPSVKISEGIYMNL